MTIYPSQYDQGAPLRKLHHKFLFIYRTYITRRMLLRDQQGRNYVAPAHIFTEKQSARLSVPRCIYRSDRYKPIQAVAREKDGPELASYETQTTQKRRNQLRRMCRASKRR